MLLQLKKDLQKLADPKKAVVSQRFFKTGKGEYGEGDVFLGITVPTSRKIAIKHKDLAFSDIQKLLASKIHEERLIALLILVHNFEKGDLKVKKKIVEYYLAHTKFINNWDLVDLSADKIIGAYLLDKPRNLLIKLAKSQSIWERRIAMIATYQFIKNGQHEDALKIATLLLSDKHDLIQKAVGWMLREVGKRCDEQVLIEFLEKNYKQMGRTTLRYAIERLPEKTKINFLKGKI